MKVKTFKRMSKRCISTLLSVLMVISLFTVCMVASTITANAAVIALPSGTIYFDATSTGWSNVYLYVGHATEAGLAGVHTMRYDLKKVKDNIWTCEFYGYDEAHYYFFSNDSSQATTAGGSVNIDTAYGNISNSNKTNQITSTITDGNLYVADSSTPHNVTVKANYEPYPFQTTGTYYIDTELYNYRNTQQIDAAESAKNSGKKLTDASVAYDIDTENGNSEKIYDLTQYAEYNTAVSEWYKTAESSTTHKSIPLYQGNFHDVFSDKNYGNKLYDNASWVTYRSNSNPWTPRSSEVSSNRDNVKMAINEDNWDVLSSLYRFDTLANGANRTTNAGSSAAVGLVDDKLTNNTLTQNGVEIPQFSDAFIAANPTLTSKYENLKFEVLTGKKDGSNNIWYRYNSAVDGNRTLKTDTNGNVTNMISYDAPQMGSYPGLNPTSAGYYPFNAGGTYDGTYPRYENVVNCTGTRFDIEFATKKEWNATTQKYEYTYNGEDLMFTFTGDDDLWVYIDGYLALDLGGSHTKADGKINLSQMYYEITTGAYDVKMKTETDDGNEYYTTAELDTDYNGTHYFGEDSEIVKSLKDTTKSHTLTVFYLERGLYDSNLSFEFMLPQTNSLTLKQEITTDTVNKGLLTETLKTANNDVFETVLVTNSADADSNDTAVLPISETFERVNNDNSTTILQATEPTTSTESPTGVAFDNSGAGGMVTAGGTTFVWNDTNTNSDGTKSSSGTGTGIVDENDGGINLLYNQSATFNDQFQTGSKMCLSTSDTLKSFVIPNTGATTAPPGTSSTNRTVSKYYNQTYVIKDNLNQDINQDDDETFYFQYNNGTKENVKLTAIYTNEVKTGTVKFTKKLSSSETDNTEFTFEVLFSNVFGGSNTTFEEYDVEYTVLDKDGNKIDADSGTGSEIKLNVGETAVITGVPIGTKYRITETGDNNDDKDYTVSDITTNSNTTAGSVEEKEVFSSNSDENIISNNVVVGVVNNATSSNDDSISHFDFNNTNAKTKIVYRFYDRRVTTGLPTSMETHYTYFTGEFNGELIVDENTSEETKEKYKQTIIDNAPNIKNILKAYNLTAENIEFNYTITDADIKGNANCADNCVAEGTGNLNVGETVILATYTPIDREYIVQFEYYDIKKGQTTTSVTRAFNELVCANNEIKSVKAYTTDDGVKHYFKYWAKKVSDGNSGTVYTPAFTNYGFNYRVTDNAVFVAVYSDTELYDEITENVGKLESPNVYGAAGDTYLPTGDGTGYDASAAERVYDSYTLDVTNNNVTTNQNRTRINVVFGSVGSLDMDTNITHVGYILIKNDKTDSTTMTYATDDLFSSESLLSQLAAYGNEGVTADSVIDINTDNKTALNGKTSFPAMVGFYQVGNNVPYAGTGLEGNYVKGVINLTNKNRLNFVFDKENTEAAQNYYYTCYTVMVREDYEYDLSGNAIGEKKKYYYVSDTPAYFNLGEAEPNISQSTCLSNYLVITEVEDQNGIPNPNAGTITTSAESTSNYIKDGQKLTITVNPTSYQSNGGIMISTLNSVRIGNVEVSADKFTKTAAGTYTYTFNFDNDVYLATRDTNNVDIRAKFNLTQDDNSVIVDSTTVNSACTNGSVQVSADGNTYGVTAIAQKNGKFYAKAIPADGYELTSWSTGATTEVIEVTVNSDGTYTIPTPTFNQYVTFTVGASNSTMGSVTVSGAKDLGNNTYKAVKDTTVTITATPGTDYDFTSWTASGGTITDTTSANTTITPVDGAVYTANFISKYITFTVATADSTMGTVSVTGATSLGNNQYKVARGSSVTIKATAKSNYGFVNWTAVGATISDSDATSANLTITPTDIAVYTANFELTSKRVNFKVAITNSWAEDYSPDFYLTYNGPDGKLTTVKLERSSANNYYSGLVAVDENTDSWTVYLLRCQKGYVPTNGATGVISGSIDNVATTTIQKSWIAGASNGGNYDLSFTFP